jgi:hypothetical protein
MAPQSGLEQLCASLVPKTAAVATQDSSLPVDDGLSTRRSHPVVMTNRSLRLGMSISPDGRFILFDQLDDSGSDLMLVRDFRPR